MTSPPPPPDFAALDACHQQIQAHLSRLASMARRVADHGVDAEARQQAGAIEAFFSGTSRQHHADEEKNVFPPLLASGSTELVTAVKTLQQDHGWIEENWIELAPRLRAIASGSQGLDDAEFQHYVEVFQQLCEEHIALEESLIYPQSKARWANRLSRRSPRGAH